MKTFTLKYKLLAIALALVFSLQSMQQINSYTYTTGIDSYHYNYSCFGGFTTHLAVKCQGGFCGF